MQTTSMQNLAEGPQAGSLPRLPAEMQALRQWCVTPGTATDKIPRMVDGRKASSTDPTTWTDFDTACRVAQEKGWRIGFVFSDSDPFTCIDLDVVDEESQREKGKPIDQDEWTTPDDYARFNSVIQSLQSYTERSRSGKGIHVIVKGDIGKGRRRDGVEVYTRARFLICTGDVWLDAPVAERQDVLSNMMKQMPEVAATEYEMTGDPLPDFALAERAALDTGELGKLYAGDWEGRYPSQSEADLALVKLLLPLTSSPRECWETFRLSKLGARKKARRASYARSTVALALQHLANDTAEVQRGEALAEGLFWKAPAHNPRHFGLLSDKDLRGLPKLQWLVKRIIPDAGIGAIYGDSGTFKSFLTLDVMAHIANGQDWFGRRVRASPAIYVPFEGQGGIPNRVDAWRMGVAKLRNPEALMIAAPPDDITTNMRFIMDPINLREAADRDKLVLTLTESGWAGGVLCIDTLAHASNGIDENSSEMGEMLNIFRDLQHRLGGVILLVHHSGKDQSRGMRGWSGLHAAMDFVIECQRDKQSGAMEAQFVLTKVKDGSDGLSFPFAMQTVVLGQDEDNEGITSLSVTPTIGEVERVAGTKQTKKGINAIDAETASADDKFIHDWVNKEVIDGKFPSKNSVKGQLPDMKETYEITQDRVLAAIERLIAAEMLMIEKELKSPNGNVWLRPLDAPQVAE